MSVPPYIDPHETGGYDTDEMDAIAAKAWAELDAAADGYVLALALMRHAYGSGYVRGVSERDE